jgi:hypothetical protein
MTEESFGSLVNRLTETHRVTVERDDGTEYPETDGLLQMLREAVFGGMSGGGGSQGKAKLPLEAAAADLLDEIDRQAAEALAQVDSRPTSLDNTEAYVARWFAAVQENTQLVVTTPETLPDDLYQHGKPRVYRVKVETTAIALVRSWVKRIEDYFVPQRADPIPGTCPNPECGQEHSWRMVDGSTVRSAAVFIHMDRETRRPFGAGCSVCGTKWAVRDIPALAEAMGYTPDEEAASLLIRGAPETLVAERFAIE